MELVLTRVYKSEGANGILTLNGHFVCFTIELPWKENQRNISCIPEGRYALNARYSTHFKSHLHVKQVEGRSLILLHPANDALKELRGCIAPVMQLSGIGRGVYSRIALDKILSIYRQASENNEKVVLTIKPDKNEYSR